MGRVVLRCVVLGKKVVCEGRVRWLRLAVKVVGVRRVCCVALFEAGSESCGVCCVALIEAKQVTEDLLACVQTYIHITNG